MEDNKVQDNSPELESNENKQTETLDQKIKAAAKEAAKGIKKGAAATAKAIKKGVSSIEEGIEKVGDKINSAIDKANQDKAKREGNKAFEEQAVELTVGDEAVSAIVDDVARTITFGADSLGKITVGMELSGNDRYYTVYDIDGTLSPFVVGDKEHSVEVFVARFRDTEDLKCLGIIDAALSNYKPGLFGKGKYNEAKEHFGNFRAMILMGQSMDKTSFERLSSLLAKMLSPDTQDIVQRLQAKHSL